MSARDRRGRWLPGQSANPAGKKPGTGRVAQFRAAIGEAVPEIIATLIAQAKAGDVQAAKVLMERALPALRPESMPQALVALPAGGSLADKGEAIIAAAAEGRIGVNEAAQLLGALGALARTLEFAELAKRIEALERGGSE